MRVLAAGMLGTSVVAVATSAHATPPAASSTGVHHPAIHENPVTQPASPHSTGRLGPAHTPDDTGAFPDAPTRPGSDGSSSADVRRQGVDVPGGWIVWPVAAGVLAATAIALLRSRTLAPASALLRAIRAARHGAADPTSEEPTTTTYDIAVLEQDATTAPRLTIGLREATDLGIDALPADGVAITGPGSTDALRGILAAAATSTNATIVIPADLLHALTGAQLSLPGVTPTHDTHAAMHRIQMEIHRRYTLTHETNTSSTDNVHPPLVLLIEPPTVQPRRLAALAELGSEHDVRIVVAGQWDAGDTWSVDRYGRTTAGTATIGRVNMLNPQGLAQLAQALKRTTGPAAVSDQAAPPEPPVSAIFHLSILGPLRLATSSSPAIHIRRSGSRQIAVYLALHPDGTSRYELLEHIFGHMTMSSATTSLDSCLYELRRLLAANDGSALMRLDDTYRLDPQLITVDWWQLLYHLRRGDLTQATTQYAGPIADGHTWPWLPEHRQNARHLIADAHAALARTATTPEQALTHALVGITIDPYSTASHDAAIDAYTRLDQADHAQTLREEMVKRLADLQRVERQRMSE
ncbi:AfsR/SARP family transcriptional regulator [Allorhizocola rhizosphaerae]|uniref:AfsR/SARP family transcriptional regulator n=1 Tax=Allorhizocola rhizosphaerae TaxID=1872709 RepID=UPI0013C2EF56|nr:hypothetical protein [Allorhizocola rhizosphaerae]